MPNFCCTFAATSLKLLPKPADEIVPISSAQFVSPEMTQIVSTSLTQNDSSQIVPLKMAQLPSLLMHTGWTNHQPNNGFQVRRAIKSWQRYSTQFGGICGFFE